ncbi:MAG: Holliday junction branch migration protein RuvA [Candidatus Obscuribacterales bacterium]|jgi:holliday junction DNA helicase RuvA|nr:Holliday junction branch migration protein RuvA [Candidatus Obscuribacterales bacterium]
MADHRLIEGPPLVIAFIKGILKSREISGGPADKLVVDVGGVGFELLVARTTSAQAGIVGEEVTMQTSLSIRENDWTLFGFTSPAEKEIFSLLQSVTGVGPKMALSLVGTLSPQRIAEAVAADDQKTLSQAPGVGPKVAQRIILELKAKMEDWQLRRGAAVMSASPQSSVHDEARSILEGLGYTLTEISHAFRKLSESEVVDDVESLVRHSLKTLGMTAER